MTILSQVSPGRIQFLDANGAPLVGGTVSTYIPSTTTGVTTYQDPNSSTANTNPITLDNLGSAAIWYNGLVRMIVRDANGNQIYDEVAGTQYIPSIFVTSRTALALMPQVTGLVVFLSEGARSGAFEWIPTIPTATHQIDTKQGIFVPPSSVANGAWVRVGYANGPISGAWFGCLDDADPTAALQASIDTTLYALLSSEVFWPARVGGYLTTDTVQLGYGVTWNNAPYTTVVLSGAGGSSIYNNKLSFGTIIYPQRQDRPALAVSAGRQTRISNLAINGGGSTYMIAQGLDYPTNNANAENIATWIPPTWPASASSRYAPYVGIAIDPYAGSTPPTPYPDVNFPSWLGSPTQYGKGASSDTVIESCYIEGFMAAVAYTPSNSANQDDFGRIRDVWFEYNVYGVAGGSIDSRLMTIEDSYLPNHHTAINAAAFGQQLWQSGAAIINVAFDRCVRWFNFGNVAQERAGPVSFINCYAENCWKLGVWAPPASSIYGNNPLILENCRCLFRFDNVLGSPPWIIDITPTACLSIIGGTYQQCCDFGGFVIRGNSAGARIENAIFTAQNDPTLPYQKFAQSASPVLFSDPRLELPYFQANWKRWDALSGSALSEPIPLVPLSGVNSPVPIYASDFRPGQGVFGSFTSTRRVANPSAGQPLTKTALAGLSLSGTELTVTFSSRSEALFMMCGPLPGDVIIDNVSGAVFYVHARTGNVVTAKLQNNLQQSGAYNASMNMNTSVNEQLIIHNTRVCGLNGYTTGTFTNGSPTISAVSNDLTGQLSAGYAIYTNSENNLFSTGASDPFVSSVTSSTVVMTGNAIPSSTGQYLSTWVIPAPANV